MPKTKTTLVANISPRSVSKTTNSAFLAHALHERKKPDNPNEYDVLAYDGDVSGQLTRWHETSGYPFPCLGAASRTFHATFRETHPPGRIGVVDVGHLEDHIAIARSILRVTDVAIVNLVPSAADTERAEGEANLKEIIYDDVASLREDGRPPQAWILLTRAPNHKDSIDVREARAYFEDEGWHVFDTVIPSAVEYMRAGEGTPLRGKGTHLDDLVTEMEKKDLL
jgi:hypothetical protein